MSGVNGLREVTQASTSGMLVLALGLALDKVQRSRCKRHASDYIYGGRSVSATPVIVFETSGRKNKGRRFEIIKGREHPSLGYITLAGVYC